MPYTDENGKTRRVLAVDFDGVISSYSGWNGLGRFGEPVEHCRTSLQALQNMGWDIIIFTTRGDDIKEVERYLNFHRIPYDKINENMESSPENVSDRKVLADVYLDDRAVTFNGDWLEASAQIIFHEPWWRK